MDDINEYYIKGIRFAASDAFDRNHAVKITSEKIKEEQGINAYNEFMRGYYKGLVYFCHAIDHIHDNPIYLVEKANRIEKDHGTEIKNAFLKGIEYYRIHEDEIITNQVKRF